MSVLQLRRTSARLSCLLPLTACLAVLGATAAPAAASPAEVLCISVIEGGDGCPGEGPLVVDPDAPEPIAPCDAAGNCVGDPGFDGEAPKPGGTGPIGDPGGVVPPDGGHGDISTCYEGMCAESHMDPLEMDPATDAGVSGSCAEVGSGCEVTGNAGEVVAGPAAGGGGSVDGDGVVAGTGAAPVVQGSELPLTGAEFGRFVAAVAMAVGCLAAGVLLHCRASHLPEPMSSPRTRG